MKLHLEIASEIFHDDVQITIVYESLKLLSSQAELDTHRENLGSSNTEVTRDCLFLAEATSHSVS